MEGKTLHSSVLIIGAGASGICFGAQLKRTLGFDDFAIYERHSDLGGTWWANTYPGCACDIPAVFYSFSFAMNPHWTSLYPSAPEIHQYFTDVATKFGLQRHMRFNTEVESATWDDKRSLWVVKLRRREVQEWEVLLGSGATEVGRGGEIKAETINAGETWTHECKVLISAVGGLVEPKRIHLEGSENFKGDIMHSAKWDHNISIENKDVIMIGSGCSAVQIVPEIASKVKSITQIARSRHWIIPRTELPLVSEESYNKHASTWFKFVPGLMRAVRLTIFALSESMWPAFKLTPSGEKTADKWAKIASDYIKKNAPEEYWPLLIPDYRVGCKRRVFDNKYAACLQRENVHLTDGTVAKVTEDTVITSTGEEYHADVILQATGYETTKPLSPLRLYGRNGEDMLDHWKKFGGPSAYQSTALNGFPNFFILFGPNSATGHSSVLLATENTTNFAIKLITPILRAEATEVEVTAKAEESYASWLQKALKKTIFQRSLCSSWYTTEDGRNSVTYPRSQIHFTIKSMFPTWGHWYYKRTSYGLWMRVFRRTLGLMVIMGLVSVGAMFRRGDLTIDLVKKVVGDTVGQGKSLLLGGMRRIAGGQR